MATHAGATGIGGEAAICGTREVYATAAAWMDGARRSLQTHCQCWPRWEQREWLRLHSPPPRHVCIVGRRTSWAMRSMRLATAAQRIVFEEASWNVLVEEWKRCALLYNLKIREQALAPWQIETTNEQKLVTQNSVARTSGHKHPRIPYQEVLVYICQDRTFRFKAAKKST